MFIRLPKTPLSILKSPSNRENTIVAEDSASQGDDSKNDEASVRLA